MEYYYQDQLRWGFGFDNPNKAAALLVSILPLLWIGWAWAWSLKRRGANVMIIFFASILLAGFFLLFKTYSRGGVVAVVAAFAYLFWMGNAAWKLDRRLAISIICAGCAVFLGFFTGIATRSTQWIQTREGSVENRLSVWKGGLQMIASVPQGVGRGNSGEFYMQWFQPLEENGRYRTLVNSYLTLATEQGIGIFAGMLLLAILIWQFTIPLKQAGIVSEVMRALRASLVGFAVAGFYTTTMEEPMLWIVPSVCVCGLVGLAMLQGAKQRFLTKGLGAVAFVVLIALGLLIAGAIFNRAEPIRISSSESILIRPARPAGELKTMTVWTDEEVMGEDYGKQLRELSEKDRLILTINPKADALIGDRILVMGRAVGGLPKRGFRQLILLAPIRVPQEQAQQILSRAESVRLILPEFDEDGRARFWQKMSEERGEKISYASLLGVGTNVSWVWNEVIHTLQ